MIRSEIEYRQVIQAPQRHCEREENGVMIHNPLIAERYESRHTQWPYGDSGSQSEQYYVLGESLPVSQMNGIAEASAVAYGIGEPKPCRDSSHHHHEGEDNL